MAAYLFWTAEKDGSNLKYFVIILFAVVTGLCTPLEVWGSIRIDSVKTTVSSCQNNGSITVYASTTRPPVSYSIIGGPVTRTQQSSNIFSSLPAGNYTIRIINALLESATTTVTISGAYTPPVFNPVKVNPYCAGVSNGIIVGNLTPGTGTAPFSWQLVAPSPVTRPAQLNDTFYNLPAGNYFIRVTDACGNFVTYVASLFNPNTKPVFGGVYVELVGCDSALVTSFINLPENAIRLPLTFRYKTKNGILTPATVTLDTTQINASPYAIVNTRELIAGLTYGDTIVTTVHNSCGDSAVATSIIPPLQFFPTYVFKNCGTQIGVNFSFSSNGSRLYGLKAPVSYVYADSATGVISDSATIKGDSTHFVYAMVYNIGIQSSPVSGKTYTLTVRDGCGKNFQGYFAVPAITTPGVVNKIILNSACIDSVAGNVRIQVKGFNGVTRLILLSGPATAGSNRPGFSYSDFYTYPDTLQGAANQQYFYLLNMAPGTWRFKVEDNCGNMVMDSLVIKPQDVTSLNKSSGYRKGCLGQNTIFYSLTHGATVLAGSHSAIVTISRLSDGAILKNQNYSTNSASDSLPNLSPGTYVVTFQFRKDGSGTYISNITHCTTLADTITIEDYRSPAILTTNSIVCSNNVNIEIIPDSTTGVPPYQYEIIAGPLTFPVQSSNLFSATQRGIYTARIYDACGNASTTSISVDTFSFSPLGRIKISCTGMKFFYTSAPGFSTTTIIHGSQTFNGDTLLLEPITAADTGTYYVTKYVSLNGCRDTFYTTFTVTLPGETNLYQTICEGDSSLLGSDFYHHPGMYRDTARAVDGCDSISILHLSVTPYKRDTVWAAICEGNSYAFNGNVYTNTGVYYDTLPTPGCDSIVTLLLTVNPYKRDSLRISLCVGQSFAVGSNVYNQTGLYTDTLATANCDSIVVLNLLINDYKRDTLTATICEGQFFAVAGNNYSLPGVYSDTLTTITCDSIVTLNLTVNPYKRDTLHKTICEGQKFTVGSQQYYLAGTYTDTLSTFTCDSIVTLYLSVTPYKRDTLHINICEGQSYTAGLHSYTISGVYADTLSTADCDSIVTLYLTVTPYKRDTLNISICEGQSYAVGSSNYSSSGIYSDTLSTLTCDSIVTLYLVVTPYKRDTLNISLCSGQGYTVGSNVYTQTGVYTDTLATGGCDSIVLLHLWVNDFKRDTLYVEICENQYYTVGSGNYFATGIYTDTLSTLTCDSIVTLYLTVNPLKRDTINAVICEEQTFTVGNSNYSATGIYSDTLTTAGCDSIITLYLTVLPLKRDTINAVTCEGQVYTVGSSNYTTSGIYTDTLTTAGCDSIVILNLTVNPYRRDTLHIDICEGQSYTVGTSIYSASGIYADTLSTVNCDSIVLLYLTVHPYKRDTLHIAICSGNSFAVGNTVYDQTGLYTDTLVTSGCDSIVTLDLTVADYIRDTIHAAICEGQSYTVGMHRYTMSGIYRDTLPTLNCDSIVTLHLTVNPLKRDTLHITICEGQVYTVGNNSYTGSGIYADTLATPGCDSIVTLYLTVNPYKRDTVSVTICEGQYFTVGANDYFSSGIYTDNLSAAGCDSIVTLHLTVNPYKRDTIRTSICEGQTFTVGSHHYIAEGIYTDTLHTAGCDSIVLLYLTVHPYKRDTLRITICNRESFTVGNHRYDQTGTYSDTLNTTGCDSIVLLHLTVNRYKRENINATICEGEYYSVGSHPYTQTGIYSDTLSTATCDSIVTLNLTVNPYKRHSISATVCEGKSYAVGNSMYTLPGIYQDTLSTGSCDSIITLSLNITPYKRTGISAAVCEGTFYAFNNRNIGEAGVYADTLVTAGCDSIVTLTLSVIPYKRGDTLTQYICEGETYFFNGDAFNQSGIYFDTIPAATGCDSIATLRLIVKPAPAARITATPQTVNPGAAVEFSTPEAASYVWTTTARLSSNHIQNPTAVFYNSAWVYLTTTSNSNECTGADSVYIQVRTDTVIIAPCGQNTYLYMPNAFVPGSTAGNAVFKIYSSNIRLVQFQVFNKWGETVFATSNIAAGWDGRYRGKITPGNYVYRITYYDCNPNQMRVKSGNILLLQ